MPQRYIFLLIYSFGAYIWPSTPLGFPTCAQHVSIGTPTWCCSPPAHLNLFRNQPFMQRLVWIVGHAQSGFHFWKKQKERELWEEAGKWLCQIYCHNRNLRGLFVLRDVQMDMMWPQPVTSRRDVTPVDVVKTLYCTNFLGWVSF